MIRYYSFNTKLHARGKDSLCDIEGRRRSRFHLCWNVFGLFLGHPEVEECDIFITSRTPPKVGENSVEEAFQGSMMSAKTSEQWILCLIYKICLGTTERDEGSFKTKSCDSGCWSERKGTHRTDKSMNWFVDKEVEDMLQCQLKVTLSVSPEKFETRKRAIWRIWGQVKLGNVSLGKLQSRCEVGSHWRILTRLKEMEWLENYMNWKITSICVCARENDKPGTIPKAKHITFFNNTDLLEREHNTDSATEFT